MLTIRIQSTTNTKKDKRTKKKDTKIKKLNNSKLNYSTNQSQQED